MDAELFRGSLVDQVYRAVRSAVCEGQLAPGTRIRQDELAARFGVSRQPVIQALALLKSEGFLEPAGRKGLKVAHLDPEHLNNLYAVRRALEIMAVREAAANAGAALEREARAAIADARRAIAAHDTTGMIDADLRFHRAFWNAANNPVIAETIEMHWGHLRWAMGNVLEMPAYPEQVLTEHDSILAAVRGGEADRAAALMDTHLRTAAERLHAELTAESKPAA